MLRLAVFVGLVAFCVARTPLDHCCSNEDRDIVQRQWKVLWRDTSSSKIKIGFSKLLLTKLAEVKPEVKALFKGVNIDNPDSPEFSAHAMRIANGMDMIINLLQDPEALDEALEHLADQHGARAGVKPEHFKAFAEILATGLRRVLDDFNSMSWRSCFHGILVKIASKLHS